MSEENESLLKKFLAVVLGLTADDTDDDYLLPSQTRQRDISPELLAFANPAVPLTDFTRQVYAALRDEFNGEVSINGNSLYIDLPGNGKFRLEINRDERQ